LRFRADLDDHLIGFDSYSEVDGRGLIHQQLGGLFLVGEPRRFRSDEVIGRRDLGEVILARGIGCRLKAVPGSIVEERHFCLRHKGTAGILDHTVERCVRHLGKADRRGPDQQRRYYRCQISSGHDCLQRKRVDGPEFLVVLIFFVLSL
jgi:hypothetical protein